MPLFTTDPTDQAFERFMKHQPNYKPDTPEADRIQAELDAETKQKGRTPMIYRDERHQHTFEKERSIRPESVSRKFLAALYLLTADGGLWNQVWDQVSIPKTSTAPAMCSSPPLGTFSPAPGTSTWWRSRTRRCCPWEPTWSSALPWPSEPTVWKKPFGFNLTRNGSDLLAVSEKTRGKHEGTIPARHPGGSDLPLQRPSCAWTPVALSCASLTPISGKRWQGVRGFRLGTNRDHPTALTHFRASGTSGPATCRWRSHFRVLPDQTEMPSMTMT